jgi:hypothetical protein
MKKLVSLFCFITAYTIAVAQIVPNIPSINGVINTMQSQGDTMYLGGTFTRLYSPDSTTYFGGMVNQENGDLVNTNFKADGAVRCAISDGNKGYFIAGDFTQIGDSIRGGLAHLDSLGNVTTKLAGLGITGTDVRALQLRGDTLIIGGYFTAVGGQARSNLAFISVANNQVLSVTVDVTCPTIGPARVYAL